MRRRSYVEDINPHLRWLDLKKRSILWSPWIQWNKSYDDVPNASLKGARMVGWARDGGEGGQGCGVVSVGGLGEDSQERTGR
ncbi:hypothetical protein HZH66_004270 [Vespula vulgaris]|uniref:Uncharacterized protein n=1 Tax=Vespula vulgaris TaxID=7454 RepID=A0A834NEP8_VESVU|nr:hypothetical protein HZH66_004270 [Vespula vulgaris]